MLPGTVRMADRFAAVFSVMRNVSVPFGRRKKDQPNLSSTIWLTVSDQKNRVYCDQDTNSPGALWVKLDKIDFKEGSGVRRFTLVRKPARHRWRPVREL